MNFDDIQYKRFVDCPKQKKDFKEWLSEEEFDADFLKGKFETIEIDKETLETYLNKENQKKKLEWMLQLLIKCKDEEIKKSTKYTEMLYGFKIKEMENAIKKLD